jgi:hypothetical protein
MYFNRSTNDNPTKFVLSHTHVPHA